MQFKPLLICACLCALTLGACLPQPVAEAPTLDPAYVESLVQTQIAAIPTPTQPAAPPAPMTDVTLTPTFIPFISTTTPTLTLFYQPTVTATPSLNDCPLIVALEDTSAGDILHVRRCEDNLEYDLGPFAKGVYAAGPNFKFIVYVTNTGQVYAARTGSTYLTLIKDLSKDKTVTTLNRGAPPLFTISFTGAAPYYRMTIYEKKFKEKYLIDVPAWLAE